MPGSERDEPNVSYPELTAALGVLRDAYQQVEAPFVFQPAADALGMQPGWMLRRRIFTLATGALATAAGIVMAFTVVVEVPRGQVQPAGVVTRLTPPSQEQPRVAVAEAVKSTRASVEVSLAVPLWNARWSVPGMTPATMSSGGSSGARTHGLMSPPSLTGFTYKPSIKTPSLTLTPRRKSNAPDGTSNLDVRDSVPCYAAAGRPV